MFLQQSGIFSGGGSGTLVYDTFTDTNGTNLTAHTPDIDTVGGGWSTNHASVRILNNKWQAGSGFPGPWSSWIDCGKTTVEVSAEITTSLDNIYWAGISTRFIDANNQFQAVFYDYWGENQVRILEISSGVYTERASVACSITLASNTSYPMTVTDDESTITISSSVAPDLSYTSSLFAGSTYVGLRSSNRVSISEADQIKADNFTVISL
jgi:hypothetical protein